ncbi:penicillin-binding protein [Galbibacter pacificus]|uniref:Penicillin-binding protein n=1 Tax=Galbibacter pacificus TaxID=2996052 RepID=A0ABT6FMM8_9FLAO|nr:penicillin-binding protein [Galbibacter pacificus]MDG3581038.1 penicillin-binding protein [Galbibacter pacificus]MDG3584516.1 penicillin-binding protein [Galbibacter pacificus]
MPITDKNILSRLYFVAGCMFFFALAVVVKLITIQVVDGEKYRGLAEQRTIKNFTIEPKRGNLYSDDGSLLATSVTKYDIRFDAITPQHKVFEENLKPLSDSLSLILGRPASYYQNLLRKARANKNRYLLIARDLGYTNYIRVKNFPLFNLGPYKGGLIVEQETKREYPLGGMAHRSVGYERVDDKGYYTRVGLEGAFGDYLRGTEGHRLKQKIAKGQWKPITDYNEVEPKDGYDVVSTINVNIQDIAHHALLSQLEKYKADHGSVVVMEVATGEIKAISNLGRTKGGKYYERLNYAVGESHEPGSTFKLMSMIAALEDHAVDTTDIIDTEKGVISFYGEKVTDSKIGGYGKITVAEVLERSSNVGIVKIIDGYYGDQPEKFVNRLYNMGLNKKLGLSIKGEGAPIIPHPNDKDRWSGIALQWMAYGYGVSFTPLQTLAFYNAVANGGEMVKPRLIKEVREWDKVIYKFDKEVINPSICSKETIKEVQAMLKNVVEYKHGTGHGLYSPNFSMAGKTGTCQKDYRDKSKLNYISSFAGYFPAENPKYSCIVVIHEPDKSVGYFGADVSGPVFKSIAQKIYTNSPLIDTIEELNEEDGAVEKDYKAYYAKVKKRNEIVPNVEGMSGMDAISILENLGLKVKIEGSGIGVVKSQSLKSGEKIKTNQTIVLQLS